MLAPNSSPSPSFVELYTPKLHTVLREPYGFAGFKADVIAGLTVAIVALPLSMAIAIASGVSPERGLYTSIVGGSIRGGWRINSFTLQNGTGSIDRTFYRDSWYDVNY